MEPMSMMAMQQGGNMATAWLQNQWDKEHAQDTRNFLEHMSATAHQREAQDLYDAGLNPILSVTGGSGNQVSSAPKANAPQIKTADSALAIQKAKVKKEKEYIEETTKESSAKAQSAKIQAEIDQAHFDYWYGDAERRQIILETSELPATAKGIVRSSKNAEKASLELSKDEKKLKESRKSLEETWNSMSPERQKEINRRRKQRGQKVIIINNGRLQDNNSKLQLKDRGSQRYNFNYPH